MLHKNFLLIFAGFFILLVMVASCSGASTSFTPTMLAITPTSPVAGAEDLAQAFITTYEAKQATEWLALFSENALFQDNGSPYARDEGALHMHDNITYVKYLFALPHFSMKFSSHFISTDGRFITLVGTYTFTGKDGKSASVPIVIILEQQDGKIIREDDYYDGSPFFN